MNLNDLLITYKQVKVPEEVKNINVELPDPINSKFDRFMSYLNEKKDKNKTTSSEKESDPDPNAFREFNGKVLSNSNNSSIGIDVGVTRTNNNSIFVDKEKQATFIDDDRPAYLSPEQLTQYYNDALNLEKLTIADRVAGAQNTKNYEQFKTDLQAFYDSPDGQQYNPENATGEARVNLERLANWLTRIAALESNYQSDISNPNSTAYGYFQITESFAKNAGVNHDTMKSNKNLQFKVAFKNIEELFDTLYSWVNTDNTTKLRAQTTGDDKFTLMYGMWWNPASVKAYLGLYPDDKENKKELYYTSGDGMDIFKILARASKK